MIKGWSSVIITEVKEGRGGRRDRDAIYITNYMVGHLDSSLALGYLSHEGGRG